MRNSDQLPLVHAPIRDQTHNLGICPDSESNPQPLFGVQDGSPTESPGQGLWTCFKTRTLLDDFVTLCTSCLENICSLNYMDLLDVDNFIMCFQKILCQCDHGSH